MGFLRTLSVEQQIALLFVIVFGLLLTVTVGGLVWSLRELSPVMQRRQERFKRDLRAVWIGTGVAALGLIGGIAWWRQRRRIAGRPQGGLS